MHPKAHIGFKQYPPLLGHLPANPRLLKILLCFFISLLFLLPAVFPKAPIYQVVGISVIIYGISVTRQAHQDWLEWRISELEKKINQIDHKLNKH